MRFLWTVPAFSPFVGGAQTLVRAMATRQAAAGHEVTVLTSDARRADDFWLPSRRACLPGRERVEGVTILRLPIRYPWPAPYRFALLRRLGPWLERSGLPPGLRLPLLRQFARSMPPLVGIQSVLPGLVAGVDVVWAADAGWDGLLLGAWENARRQARFLGVIPLIHLGGPGISAAFTMAHQVAVYRTAQAVVALSRRERERLGCLGVGAERLHRLPMGVDPDGAEVAPGAVERLRRDLGAAGPVVAFVGATTYDKGAFTLADAVPRLARLAPGLRVVFAGPERERLAAYMAGQDPGRRRVWREHIRLLGVVDEGTKQALLAACQVLALPSRVDSFGIVVLEAGLHARPVVAADVGGLAETVVPGETGLLVPFGDAEALAAALARLLENPREARQMGLAGRRRVEVDYTWDRTYERLQTIHADSA